MISIGTLNYQAEFENPPIEAFYITQPGTYQTKFGAELLFMDHFFVGGSVETWETVDIHNLFAPNQSLYVFSAGARTHGLEIKFTHECDHITLPGALDMIPNQGFLANRNELTISYHGEIKLF
jgi:hypothetical protein